jgi:beta-galactosidase
MTAVRGRVWTASRPGNSLFSMNIARSVPKVLALVFAAAACGVTSAPARENAGGMNLAGSWRFRLDPQDAGEREKWQTTVLPERIKLPGTTDEAGYGTPTTGSDPGTLTRVFKYYGPAWYQRDIIIPRTWQDKEVDLFLERVLWESKVWVDDDYAGTLDSLNTPHRHRLGRLRPGRHRLTVRVSNLMIHPISTWGHCFTEQTQTIWNGVVGRLELQTHDPLSLGLIRVFPKADNSALEVEIEVRNLTGSAQEGELQLGLKGKGGVVARTRLPFSVPADRPSWLLRRLFPLPIAPAAWSEFDGRGLYTLETSLQAGPWRDQRDEPVGFRTISRSGQHIAINGAPAFFRGNLDCVHFPRTGYPPTDPESWRKLFAVYRDYGLNHVRFHSWTPPEAAFTAADELGIYIQCEVVWTQRRLGSDQPGPVDNPAGDLPESFRRAPGIVDDYVRAEMRRVLDAYGNHPSFVLFTIGNELGGSDFKATGEWLREEKARDPRRLYAASTARVITPYCDYNATHAVPGIGWCRDRVDPSNNWDYEAIYAKAPVPIIAHEVGQWPTYPEWKEIKEYRGVLRARNLEGFRALADKNGVRNLDKEFRAASGALALRLYKDEIESHLRTPSCSGFQLLSMQDFSGQGEALVGWLDSFYDPKGLVTAARFRRWCNPVVPLARLSKYVFTASETVTSRLEVANYGPSLLQDRRAFWRLKDEKGKTLHSGSLGTPRLPAGAVSAVGCFEFGLERSPVPGHVRLEAGLEGTSYINDWDLWVFPDRVAGAEPVNVTICETLEGAIPVLAQGGRVLLLAHKLGDKSNAALAAFKPAYWSAAFFPGSQTLGALVRPEHPALAGFPTGNHLDWQWHSICQGARGFDLAGLPAGLRPIVQPVSDFHFNRKLASVFECRTGAGGRLLVCGYNLADHLAERPAARQLRHSLLAYMAGPEFAPREQVTTDGLRKLFPVVQEAFSVVPPGFEKAVLHVKAGANHPATGNLPWNDGLDQLAACQRGFAYSVTCEAVWKDSVGTAWHARKLGVKLTVPKAARYDCYVHFHDWNHNQRSGTLLFEGRKFALGDHTGEGRWVKFEVLREDCLDGSIKLEANVDSGPNLMITEIALVPRE